MTGKIKKIENLDDLKKNALTVLFYGAVGFFGWKLVIKPAIDKIRQNNQQNKLVTDVNSQQATIFYNAMNPSGIKWMRNFDQTNEQAIFEAAQKVTDWAKVKLAYRNLYQRDLLTDLQRELDTGEYSTLMNILQSNSPNPPQGTVNKTNAASYKGHMIVANTDVRLRSTPDSNVPAYALNTNVLGVAKKGSFLGWATGELKVDTKGVKYLKVKIQFTEAVPDNVFSKLYSKTGSKTITFWVGSGAVDKHKYYKSMFDAGTWLYKGVKDMGLRANIK